MGQRLRGRWRRCGNPAKMNWQSSVPRDRMGRKSQRNCADSGTFTFGRGFCIQQQFLPRQSAAESAGTVFGGDPMTGNENRQRIRSAGRTDGAHGFWLSNGRGDLSVGACLSARNLFQRIPDGLLKHCAVRVSNGWKLFFQPSEKFRGSFPIPGIFCPERFARRRFQCGQGKFNSPFAVIQRQRDPSPCRLKCNRFHCRSEVYRKGKDTSPLFPLKNDLSRRPQPVPGSAAHFSFTHC
ncbi:MAG: hypothetical protein PWQ89_618 [Verrucomicrobiota bacterium]|nr:hypothetical protein [Verrucomicrobiota bacterium]